MQAMPTPNLRTGTVEQKRAEIKAYFLDSFDTYESLFSCLAKDEAFYVRPEKLRHPLIFYYGHTATFFINKLGRVDLCCTNFGLYESILIAKQPCRHSCSTSKGCDKE